MTGAPRGHALFLAGAIAVVALAIGAGFYVLGGPATVRARRLDLDRVSDLRSLSATIASVWSDHAQLPPSLDSLARSSPWAALDVTDPVTNEPYEYRPLGGASYMLCAVFERASDSRDDPRWSHPAGRHCFTLEAGVVSPSKR